MKQNSIQDPKTLSSPRKHVMVGNDIVSYREKGEGKPVFFLHGMNGESGSWVYQLEALSQDHRVIAWDAPGYSDSTPVNGNISDHAHRALDFLTALKAENPVVIGHSMGGVIAGSLAINYPDSVKALVLSCSHWGWGIKAGEPLHSRYNKRIEELKTMDIEEYASLRASKMTAPGVENKIIKYLGELSKSISEEALRYVGRANQEADNLAGLAELRMPLYILWGERDRVIKKERTEIMLEKLTKAKSILMPGIGHAPYVESPYLYNGIIETILKEIHG